MCPLVGLHAPPCRRKLWGTAQPCGVSLTTGGNAPASLRYDRFSRVARVAGPRCLAGDPLHGFVPAQLSRVVAMAPSGVCHGPGCSPAALGPVALDYHSCYWTDGSAGSPSASEPGFVAPCPSAALGAFARAVSWVFLVRCLWPLAACLPVRVLCVACACCRWLLWGSPPLLIVFVFFFLRHAILLLFLLLLFVLCLACLVLSCFCFSFFFVTKSKSGKERVNTTGTRIWATETAMQQCCLSRRGAGCWCFLRGRVPRVPHARRDVQGCGSGWVPLGVSLRLG